ncbi:hypothetical protein K449DRAFT_391547 [Hypoxylon sp. EC38]|nr:hypothetical protein K449DRAFT_391547 [Hypoxylon sp. EC38]
MHANALSTFTLLALGSLLGTTTANERWKITEYSDIGCDDFLGTRSDTQPSGCHKINHSVKTLSLKLEGPNGRCGWTVYGYQSDNCDGNAYPMRALIENQCERWNGNAGWGSYSTHANPCP